MRPRSQLVVSPRLGRARKWPGGGEDTIEDHDHRHRGARPPPIRFLVDGPHGDMIHSTVPSGMWAAPPLPEHRRVLVRLLGVRKRSRAGRSIAARASPDTSRCVYRHPARHGVPEPLHRRRTPRLHLHGPAAQPRRRGGHRSILGAPSIPRPTVSARCSPRTSPPEPARRPATRGLWRVRGPRPPLTKTPVERAVRAGTFERWLAGTARSWAPCAGVEARRRPPRRARAPRHGPRMCGP